MAGDAVAALADLLEDLLGSLERRRLSRTERLSELAEVLAGTADKKSRAYKSARRRVERWEPGPGRRPVKPTKVNQRRLRGARRQQSATMREFRQLGGAMKLQIEWYLDRGSEWVPPHNQYVHIPIKGMRSVLRLWSEDEREEAADELLREFLRRYKVGNPSDWLMTIVVLDLRLFPSREGM